jgi:thymidylate synthase
MKQYHDLLQKILNQGVENPNRTGVGALSIFGHQMRFDLRNGFPLLTTKFTSFKLVAAEVLWFLSGSTNNEHLRKLNGNNKPTIWEEWQSNGDLGPIYGAQWRSWRDGRREYDQIDTLIKRLKSHPHSRRHVVSTWNVADLPDETLSPQENVEQGLMALAPCHCLFQFYVEPMDIFSRANWLNDNNHKTYIRLFLDEKDSNVITSSEFYSASEFYSSDDKIHTLLDKEGVPKYYLSCQLYQRSCDSFLGLPFNIASYALLTHMIAHVVGMVSKEFVWTGGDIHLYENHIEQAKKLLSRDPKRYPLSMLKLNSAVTNIDDFTLTDIELINYQSYPKIEASVAV